MYWKSILFSFLVLFCSVIALGQNPIQLTDDAEISIMTLGPYQGELYSVFGHSGIHIKDLENGINIVYDYGRFSFNQENFYWNFARGYMLYSIGSASYDRFVSYYKSENRYIIERYLDLTSGEKQQVYDFLIENYKPENKEYLYNYVYNNCASKIPDLMDEIFPGRITFYDDYSVEGKSVRDLMDDYLDYQPWGDWIIDIGLGSRIDQEADAKTYLFLPEYVDTAFAKATIIRDSVKKPLVSRTDNVFTPVPEDQKNGVFTPFNVFVFFFFVVGFITNRDFKKEKRTKWIDPIVFSLAGILGWWLMFLWFGTMHISQNNFNLLWAIPLHIPFVYMLGVKRFRPFLRKYFLYVSFLYVGIILFWGLIPQPLHTALIPLIVTMILRGFYIYFDLSKQIRRASLSTNGKAKN